MKKNNKKQNYAERERDTQTERDKDAVMFWLTKIYKNKKQKKYKIIIINKRNSTCNNEFYDLKNFYILY